MNLKREDLQAKYPGSPPEAIDFLEKILVFNPYFRISLDQCFEHPLFKMVRKEQIENVLHRTKPISVSMECTMPEMTRSNLGLPLNKNTLKGKSSNTKSFFPV